jgi:hypothetical protein
MITKHYNYSDNNFKQQTLRSKKESTGRQRNDGTINNPNALGDGNIVIGPK